MQLQFEAKVVNTQLICTQATQRKPHRWWNLNRLTSVNKSPIRGNHRSITYHQEVITSLVKTSQQNAYQPTSSQHYMNYALLCYSPDTISFVYMNILQVLKWNRRSIQHCHCSMQLNIFVQCILLNILPYINN